MPFTKEERAKLKAERYRAEVAAEGNDGNDENVQPVEDGTSDNMIPCCVPFGCNVGRMVNILDPDDAEKVVCNNADCIHGEYMHKPCFLAWEDEVLTYLRSSGRARSWSEKQRRQNLWTKKGYDLAWKACSCQCAKGHLRKDLDWIPPKRTVADNDEANQRIKQRRRKKSSDKPSIGKATALPSNSHGGSGHGRHRHASASSNENHTPPQSPLVRSDSLSSPSQSPRNSSSNSAHSASGIHAATNQQQGRCKHYSGGNKQESFEWPSPRQCSSSRESSDSLPNMNRQDRSGADREHTSQSGSLAMPHGQQHLPHAHDKNDLSKSNEHFDNMNTYTCPVVPQTYKEQNKLDLNHGLNHDMPFIHRVDLSTFFKMLPPQKCNPYHIRMDSDQGSENDEIRGFVLSALAAHGVGTMICSLCQNNLPVFDCYPLVDGTFYLTPLNHNDVNLRLVLNGRVQYLGAVCMQCLEGVKHIVCRICNSRWDGSHHQLGTLYSYDIFAASPCCPGRVSCKKCGKPVTDPTRGTHFFSDYSQNVPCPHCGVPDFHFVKPLSSYEVLRQEINTC